jgi:uncharacterized membrane protein YgaE (UPF0421/DUF939 family)
MHKTGEQTFLAALAIAVALLLFEALCETCAKWFAP